VLDVSGWDKLPRKGRSRLTLLGPAVNNKTDLAPLVVASLE